MKKVTMFFPCPTLHSTVVPPISVLAIARMISDEYQVAIINESSNAEWEDLLKEELSNGEHVLFGVSAFTGYQISSGLRVSRWVKKHFPSVPIVWGGWHPTCDPSGTCSDPNVDVVVRGQGEVTFKELVRSLDNGDPLDNIAGISFKRDGEIIQNPERPLSDLNAFPPMPWHLVNRSEVVLQNSVLGNYAYYYTSQGCPYSCTFCAEGVYSNRLYKTLKPERVVDELEVLTRTYGVDTVKLLDSEFFLNKKQARGIASGIIDRGLQLKLVGVNGRIDTLLSCSHEDWSLFRDCGIKEILVGAESGDQEVLQLLHKQIDNGDIFKVSDLATKYGITLFVSLMTGIPGVDNDREFYTTIDLVGKMLKKKDPCITDVHIFQYVPYPGTGLYNRAISNGFVAPKHLEEWSKFDLDNAQLPWLSESQQTRNKFVNQYILRHFISYPHAEGFRKLVQKVVDVIFQYRWKKRYFYNSLIERKMIDVSRSIVYFHSVKSGGGDDGQRRRQAWDREGDKRGRLVPPTRRSTTLDTISREAKL